MVINFVFDELEFGEVLREVKKHCLTEQGLRFFDHIKFFKEKEELEKEQKKFLLFSSVIESGKKISLGGGTIVHLPDFFSPQFILSPKEIVSLYKNYSIAESLYKNFIQSEDFNSLFKGFVLLPDFKNAVRKTFEEDGSFKENASAELSSLYKSFRKVEKNIKSALNKALTQYKDYVFEPIITKRNDRYVIPINKNFKGRINCLVHDVSHSGATAFVEPVEVVDLNNKLIEISGAIEEEKAKILSKLTSMVLENREIFNLIDKILAYFDSLNARYRFMKKYGLSVPSVKEGEGVFLRQAGHPLLMFSGKKIVKNDVILTPEKRILIVSGSNTGGKTVFLKMTGLLVLMCQCVIPIPAEEGSFFSPFENILTDIGDRQNIAESLSTFSSHLTRIKFILENADSKTLVLIDELGTGTEPTDGAAIARSVVLALIERNSFAVLTTHHQDVSSLAFDFEVLRLASVDFNMETLSPTYRLIYDVPGSSHAVDIARKLGLPRDFLKRAEEYSDKVNKDYAKLISVLSEKVKTYQDLSRRLELKEKKLAEKEKAVEEKEESLKRLKVELERDMRRDFERFLSSYRKEKEKLLRHIGGEARKKANDFEKNAEKEFFDKFESKVKTESKESDGILLEEGDRVRHAFFGLKGVVESVSGNKVLIVSEGKKIWASKGDLELIGKAEKKKGKVSVNSKPAEKLYPLELNLIGKTVDEAIEIIDRQLDRAILEGFEQVRIVHGHGTGRLKKGIRRFLEKLPYVKEIRPDSGDAATVVVL